MNMQRLIPAGWFCPHCRLSFYSGPMHRCDVAKRVVDCEHPNPDPYDIYRPLEVQT